MILIRIRTICILAILSIAAGACNPRQSQDDDDGRCDPLAPDCENGLVCEAYFDGEHRCAVAIVIVGRVQRLSDAEAIEGALVQAVDINGAAVGTSAATGADGAFELTVPALRDENGLPAEGIYTLRVQAAAYQEFPTAIRPALPLNATSAVENEDRLIIESPLTTVGLIRLPGDSSLLGSISGTVYAEFPAGVLVVAESATAAFVGFADSAGVFIVFNVPAGDYTLKAYAAGVQVEPKSVSLDVAQFLTAINLTASSNPLSTVTGNVQIVNAPGGSITNVVLAVESTFDEAAARGQVPPGLRIGGVTGAFSIPSVPNGRYVVLAAFENDNLVRDPDENISGTQIVHIEVPNPVTGNTVTITEGFKVTEALDVVSPGADGPGLVSSLTPTFTWADDSSEDGYTFRVLDTFGTLIWETELGPTTGSAVVNLTYAGPPLDLGMFYQFRVTSFRERSGSRSAISTTEDLKGVFYFATN